MNGTSGTRVKHFDFDNDTSKNIFSRPYIYYMAGERLQEEEQFHTSFPYQNAFEKCNKKTELFNGKSYIKTLSIRL